MLTLKFQSGMEDVETMLSESDFTRLTEDSSFHGGFTEIFLIAGVLCVPERQYTSSS